MNLYTKIIIIVFCSVFSLLLLCLLFIKVVNILRNNHDVMPLGNILII